MEHYACPRDPDITATTLHYLAEYLAGTDHQRDEWRTDPALGDETGVTLERIPALQAHVPDCPPCASHYLESLRVLAAIRDLSTNDELKRRVNEAYNLVR